MPISLTTISPGADTSATTLRGLVEQIETYVNEQTVAADRTTSWLKSAQMYRPDFQYALQSKEVPMPGAHIFWNERGLGRNSAAFYSYHLGDGPLVVPGLSRTIQIPEDIGSGYAVVIRCWFVAYEYGGAGLQVTFAPPDMYPTDTTAAGGGTERAASFYLQINNDAVATNTARYSFAASDYANANPYLSRFYARKQHTMLHIATGTTLGGAGTHDIKVVCNPLNPVDLAYPDQLWKHIFVTQGVMTARVRLR